jgi:hypothetical protein
MPKLDVAFAETFKFVLLASDLIKLVAAVFQATIKNLLSIKN